MNVDLESLMPPIYMSKEEFWTRLYEFCVKGKDVVSELRALRAENEKLTAEKKEYDNWIMCRHNGGDCSDEFDRLEKENAVHMETITRLTADLATVTKERDALKQGVNNEKEMLVYEFKLDKSYEKRIQELQSRIGEAEWLLNDLSERSKSAESDMWEKRCSAFLAAIPDWSVYQ